MSIFEEIRDTAFYSISDAVRLAAAAGFREIEYTRYPVYGLKFRAGRTLFFCDEFRHLYPDAENYN